MPEHMSTPNRLVGMLASSAAEQGIDSAASSASRKASTVDPSPAHTFGDSAGERSMPETPRGVHDNADSEGLLKAMAGITIDDAHQPSSVPTIKTLHADHHVAESDIVRPATAPADDPFISSNNSDGTTVVSPGKSETSATQVGPEHGKVIADSVNYAVREDRADNAPSNSTAQAHFGPEACVFVANLSQSMSDENLEYGVNSTFSRFGSVWVKIRRDRKAMPFAFCQFEDKECAQDAIHRGRGLMIYGRPCRTEVARVNRALYLSKLSGGRISEAEARELLEGYGAIESIWIASETEREINGLPEGIWVRFHFFDDFRDAQAAFRDHPVYRFEQPRKSDLGIRWGSNSRNGAAHAGSYASSNGSSHMHSGYDTASLEECSLFVGSLPMNMSKDGLRHMFERYGPVVDVTIFHKPVAGSSGRINVFGFVEFVSRDFAERAHAGARSQLPHLRVEFKESRRTQHQPANAHPLIAAQYNMGHWAPAYPSYNTMPMHPSPMPAVEQGPTGVGYALPKSWYIPSDMYGQTMSSYPMTAMQAPYTYRQAHDQLSIPAVTIAEAPAYEWPANTHDSYHGSA